MQVLFTIFEYWASLNTRLDQDMHKTDECKQWRDHSSESVLILDQQSDLPSSDIDLPLGPAWQKLENWEN